MPGPNNPAPKPKNAFRVTDSTCPGRQTTRQGRKSALQSEKSTRTHTDTHTHTQATFRIDSFAWQWLALHLRSSRRLRL
eukprot:13656494-Alexandrium_andersonii.AAC.1